MEAWQQELDKFEVNEEELDELFAASGQTVIKALENEPDLEKVVNALTHYPIFKYFNDFKSDYDIA